MPGRVSTEIDRASASGELLGVDVIRRWQRLMTLADWGRFTDQFFDGRFGFCREARPLATSGLIRKLTEIAEHGAERHDDDELTAGEALEYLRALFWMLWMDREENGAHLEQMKAGFAALVRSWPEPAADLVVLIVLEHLLIRNDIQAFFADWETRDDLREPFREAVHLSTGRIEPTGPPE